MERIIKSLNEIGSQKGITFDDAICFEYNGNILMEIANDKGNDLGLKKIDPMTNGLSENRWYVWFREELNGVILYIGRPTNLNYPPTYKGFWKSSAMNECVYLAKDRLMGYIYKDIYEIPQTLGVEIEKIYNRLVNVN